MVGGWSYPGPEPGKSRVRMTLTRDPKNTFAGIGLNVVRRRKGSSGHKICFRDGSLLQVHSRAGSCCLES